MSEPPTPESEVPRQVAKKKGRAKAVRKKVAKQASSTRKAASESGSERGSGETPPTSSPRAELETVPSSKNASTPSEPSAGRDDPRGASPRGDRHEVSQSGTTHSRRAEEPQERGHDRGSGGASSQENRGSRNRRRNRGERSSNHLPTHVNRRPPEAALDLEELKAKAWHIYSTEVCEEGIRFVDDTDAGKLVRRCYKLAETFLRFQYRLQSARPERDEYAPVNDEELRVPEDEADEVESTSR